MTLLHISGRKQEQLEENVHMLQPQHWSTQLDICNCCVCHPVPTDGLNLLPAKANPSTLAPLLSLLPVKASLISHLHHQCFPPYWIIPISRQPCCYFSCGNNSKALFSNLFKLHPRLLPSSLQEILMLAALPLLLSSPEPNLLSHPPFHRNC